MSSTDGDPKIGAGHASAMARQGLAELRAALYPGSNVAQPTEYGIWGRPTPQEVVSSKQATREESDSVIEARMEPAHDDREQSKDRAPPEPERD